MEELIQTNWGLAVKISFQLPYLYPRSDAVVDWMFVSLFCRMISGNEYMWLYFVGLAKCSILQKKK